MASHVQSRARRSESNAMIQDASQSQADAARSFLMYLSNQHHISDTGLPDVLHYISKVHAFTDVLTDAHHVSDAGERDVFTDLC